MISYKTSDIIKMALSLADLSNSSFITFGDNIKFVNEAYMKLYQKMIDAGDKYYLKTYTLSGSISGSDMEAVYALPNDFYQLYSVQIVPTCVPILRKSKNEPKNSQRYDLVNNNLIIYGNITDNIEISYFPKPQTVSYTNDSPISISLPTNIKYIHDCNGSKYFYLDTSNSGHIYDADLGTTVDINYASSTTSNYAYYLSNTNIISTSGVSSVSFYSLLDSTSGELSFGGSQFKGSIFKLNGKCSMFIYNINSPSINHISILNGINNSRIDTNIKITRSPVLIASNGRTLVYTDSESNFYYVNEFGVETQIDNPLIGNNIYVFGNDYYFYNSGLFMLTKFDGLEFTLISDPIYKFFGINKSSYDTGYGYTSYGDDGYAINGIFPDIELNYPSNSLYTLMAYYLAILYCTKQQKDTTLLETAAEKVETQYFGMLDNDVNLNYRITNISTSVGM